MEAIGYDRLNWVVSFDVEGAILAFCGRLPTRMPNQNMAHKPPSMKVTAKFGKIAT